MLDTVVVLVLVLLAPVMVEDEGATMSARAMSTAAGRTVEHISAAAPGMSGSCKAGGVERLGLELGRPLDCIGSLDILCAAINQLVLQHLPSNLQGGG